MIPPRKGPKVRVTLCWISQVDVGNDLPKLTNSTAMSRAPKQSGQPLPNHRQQQHDPRGGDRERITSARQAAEALFTPKPAEPVSDPAPSAEHPARKPARALNRVAATGP
jgi:hypothetical protein